MEFPHHPLSLSVHNLDDPQEVLDRLARVTIRTAERVGAKMLKKAWTRVDSLGEVTVYVDEGGAAFYALVEGARGEGYDVGLQVLLEDDWEVTGSCDCPVGGRYGLPCKHVVALLLVVAGALKRARGDGRGNWRGGLSALDSFLDVAAPQPQGEEGSERIQWRVGRVHGGPLLWAYLQKARAGGKGWTAGRKLSSRALAYRSDLDRSPQVRAVRRVVRQSSLSSSTRAGLFDRRERTAAALMALIGSSHVRSADDPSAVVRVVRAELTLGLVVREDGALKLEARLGEATVQSMGYVPASTRYWAEFKGDTIYVGEVEPHALALAGRLSRVNAVFPAEQREALFERLGRMAGVLPIDVPTELRAEVAAADARLRVRLSPEEERLRVELRFAPTNDALVAPGQGARVAQGWHQGRFSTVERDLVGERALGNEVAHALGLSDPAAAGWSWELPLAAGLDAIVALEHEYTDHPRVLIEWPLGERLTVSRSAGPDELRVQVNEANDWFGLQAAVEVDGEQVPLEALFRALQRGERYVALDRRRWLQLSRELQGQLRALVEVAQPVERGGKVVRLELDATAAPVLEALSDEVEVEFGERWGDVLKRLKKARRVKTAPPKALRAELRDYQLEGFAWLKRLATWGVGACLADDMGLGKTLQALAVLLARQKAGPALVVAPTSVEANWARELERFTPSLRAIVYRESERSEASLAKLGPRDVLIVSYDLARIDRDRLASREWASAVFDEAQQVKNGATKTARALRSLKAEWRLALTGTPIENHLGDLWSLFALISPGLFGSWERFKKRYAIPIERDHDPERAAALARRIQPFVLRRSKEEVLADLPPLTEVNLEIELSADERRLYEETRLAVIAQLTQPQQKQKGKARKRRFEVLAALTRLRQLACHPRLVDASWSGGSAKLNACVSLVRDLREGGHRALIFSQFVRHLELVHHALEAEGLRCVYLDGSTPARARQKLVDTFQAGEGDAFLISLKAGGKGLNLTGADYVIHLDPWWNPAAEDQASDRAHRIGQERPVTVYRLVSGSTIEDTILQLHAKKRDLVDRVLAGSDRSGKLSPDELLSLIQTGDAAAPSTPRLPAPLRSTTESTSASAPQSGWVSSSHAQRLQALRERHGINQAQLGELLGASGASVSRWEGGASPRSHYVERLTTLEGLSARAIKLRLRG